MFKRHENAVKDLAPVLKLLAEPNRLRILLSLGLECRPVTDLIEATGLAQTNVSFHLRALREAGLVRAERRGPFIYYCLPNPDLLHILNDLDAWLVARAASGATNGAAKPARDLRSRDPARARVSPVSRRSRRVTGEGSVESGAS